MYKPTYSPKLQCSVCHKASTCVGFHTIKGFPEKLSLCDTHARAWIHSQDQIQDHREFLQWQHHDWYRQAYPDKFASDPFSSLGDRLRQKRLRLT
jgi:hypothetical protein